MTLPERIRWLRLHGPAGRLSHDKFAELLGTSRQTVIGWERGQEPRLYAEKLAAFSDGYGFPAEAFTKEGELLLLRERVRQLERAQ